MGIGGGNVNETTTVWLRLFNRAQVLCSVVQVSCARTVPRVFSLSRCRLHSNSGLARAARQSTGMPIAQSSARLSSNASAPHIGQNLASPTHGWLHSVHTLAATGSGSGPLAPLPLNAMTSSEGRTSAEGESRRLPHPSQCRLSRRRFCSWSDTGLYDASPFQSPSSRPQSPPTVSGWTCHPRRKDRRAETRPDQELLGRSGQSGPAFAAHCC